MILPSGISSLDRLLGRGVSTGVFTHVFGKAASGKTTFALGFVRSALNLGIRTLYINSEASSPVERLEQIIGKNYKEIEHQLTLLMPKSFDEQGTIVEDLELYIKDDTSLVVVDTLTRLYRIVLDDKQASYVAHRELNRQAGLLKGLARKHDIAVVVLNQVRAKMDEPGAIEPVATSIMDYWSDYVIRMTARRETGTRLVERLSPEGDPSSTVLYLTDDGLSGNQTQEK
ncbi:MAG: ATPase domain-containing protein [Candidatus Thorarchaeota archaeon]|nr:ATPase domain-containing protein [Candidatus Thorarchaeota archaeon]